MNIHLPLATALFVCLSPLAAQTSPSVSTKLVGTQKFTIPANSSRSIGVNYVRPVLALGRSDSCTTTTFTDQQVNFASALAGKKNLWLEITSGNYNGIATPVSVSSTYTLTTDDNITTYAPQGSVYQVREAHTIGSLFGTANTAGLNPSSTLNLSGNTDEVQVPDGSGGYRRVFYSTLAAGWREVGDETSDASTIPVFHVDALVIQRRATTDLHLNFAGFVRSNPTYFPILAGTTTSFNAAYPTGNSLNSSGLSNQVKKGTETTADLIRLPNSSGGWDTYYYANALPPSLTAGWKQVGEGNTDKGGTILGSCFQLQRRGTTANIKLLPGPTYTGL